MKPTKSADIKRTLLRRCANSGIPVSGTFELTPRCNLRCKMCYVRMTPEQMAPVGRERTAEEWLDLAKSAVDEGMMFLLITGGEPTLRSDFTDIYAELAKMGLSISINTNGTMLTDEIKELWHRYPPAQINVTLYGTSREDYENLCGNGQAFDEVIKNLRWLKNEGILVHLNTTINPINLPKLEQIEKLACEMEIELRTTVYCFPPARRDGCDNCAVQDFSRITPECAGRLIARDKFRREGKEGIARLAQEIRKAEKSPTCADTGEKMKCMAGRSQFWVTWNGDMTPCGMLNTPVTRPFENGFKNEWENLKDMTREITLCPDCANCEMRNTCTVCAAVTYTETGRFDGKPEYVCKMNEAYRNAILEEE